MLNRGKPETKMELLQNRFLNAGGNILTILFITLNCALLVWIAQYHWGRRKLYRLASQRNGPFALPFVGNAFYFMGSAAALLDKMVKLVNQYESPVRVWIRNQLYYCTSNPNDFETVMNSPYALEKGDFYKYAKVVVGNGILTADVPTWKRHRRAILPAFNQKILDSFVEPFAEKSEILVEQLKKIKEGEFLDIFPYISKCSLDIFCDTTMGINVKAQTTDCDYMRWLNRGMEIQAIRMFTLWYHSDFIFSFSPLKKEVENLIAKIKEFTNGVVVQKKEEYLRKMEDKKNTPEAQIEDENPKFRKAFLERLIEFSEQGEHFTDDELRQEVDTFMIAGSDTSALMESFTLLTLGMFPEIQDRVYEEIMDVLGPEKSVEYTDLGNFKYLERVIKETMRMFPSGGILLRTATQDIQLENCVIPSGSTVLLNTVALHRDPKVWTDPLKFDPDRFLPEKFAKQHPYSWMAFSGGPRNCVGPKYAMMAMKTVLSTVLRKFRVTTEYKNVEEVKLKLDILTKPVYGFKVALHARE